MTRQPGKCQDFVESYPKAQKEVNRDYAADLATAVEELF